MVGRRGRGEGQEVAAPLTGARVAVGVLTYRPLAQYADETRYDRLGAAAAARKGTSFIDIGFHKLYELWDFGVPFVVGLINPARASSWRLAAACRGVPLRGVACRVGRQQAERSAVPWARSANKLNEVVAWKWVRGKKPRAFPGD